MNAQKGKLKPALLWVAGAVAVVAILAAWAAPVPTAAQGKPITVGLLPPFPFYWATYVADEHGFFKEQGLSVETIQLSRPSEAVQALVGGSLNFTQVSADAYINAIEAGAKIAIVGQTIGDPSFSVVVQPEYKSWRDIKGKSVAISAPKDGAAIVFRLMAKANGLGDGDFNFLPVGTTPNRYAALKNRSADLAILLPPFDFLAVADGFRLLARSDSVLPRYAFIMIGTNTAWAQSHREEVKGYLTALARATDWLYNPANRNAAIDAIAKKMPKISREHHGKIHSLYFEESAGKIMTRGVRVDPEGLRIYGQAMKDLDILKGSVDPARWTDLSYQPAVGR